MTLVIETKRSDVLDEQQMQHHLAGIASATHCRESRSTRIASHVVVAACDVAARS
jgi:hypothetical protein